MTSKLRGSRLEAEVDKARTDGNWKRLSELLPAVKSKSSGLENQKELLEAEVDIETFFEQQSGSLRARIDNYDSLKRAESGLESAIRDPKQVSGVILEAHLLMAKLHYACAQYKKALKDVENSGMEGASTPFHSLRSLRLVAEAYAVKGLCLEGTDGQTALSQKALNCFEKSAELAISYVAELEKIANAPKSPLLPAAKQEKLGDILECCLERVAKLRLKESIAKKLSEADGIEWYRKIITCFGDKSTCDRLQQRLSRQLAEILIRAVPQQRGDASQALNSKSQNLSFYTGSQRGYFAPSSRIEEIVLLLLISEVLSTREVILSRNEDLAQTCALTIRNAKSVYNLLTLVMSSLHQYQILSDIYERAMKFANDDAYLWQQFGLALLCRGRWIRAARVMDQTLSLEGPSTVPMRLLASQLHMYHLSQYDMAFQHATKAVEMCRDSPEAFLLPRCKLMASVSNGLLALREPIWDRRKAGLNKTVVMLEDCVNTDPHDYLTLYYCALFHAIVRDLEGARERCARSLELNTEQPAAYMLLALLFTADGDLKGAMELVQTALRDFPHHYGLLVLRLHIESKFGRIEDSIDTCAHLLEFWRKQDCFVEDDRNQQTISDGRSVMREGSVKTGTPSLNTRDITPNVSVSAGFPPTVQLSLAQSVISSGSQAVIDNASPDPLHSENGNSSDSGFGQGFGLAANACSKFRSQANMWLSLSELFLNEGRINDVAPCVEQAVTLFPHSHQALYLKARLIIARMQKVSDETQSEKMLGEAKSSLLLALALCPSHLPSMSHLAQLYLLQDNVLMAEQLYRELVRIDPLEQEWWHALGGCQMRRGDAKAAAASFATAVQLDRSTPLLPFSAIPLVLPCHF